jgi:hypothetical protein
MQKLSIEKLIFSRICGHGNIRSGFYFFFNTLINILKRKLKIILVRTRVSGSADPYLWLMDPDSNPDPNADPDPAIFVSDDQDVNKKLLIVLFEATFT